MSEAKRAVCIEFHVSETVARAIQEKDDKTMLYISDAAMNAVNQILQQDGLSMDDYCRELELHSVVESEVSDLYIVRFKLKPKQ